MVKAVWPNSIEYVQAAYEAARGYNDNYWSSRNFARFGHGVDNSLISYCLHGMANTAKKMMSGGTIYAVSMEQIPRSRNLLATVYRY